MFRSTVLFSGDLYFRDGVSDSCIGTTIFTERTELPGVAAPSPSGSHFFFLGGLLELPLTHQFRLFFFDEVDRQERALKR